MKVDINFVVQLKGIFETSCYYILKHGKNHESNGVVEGVLGCHVYVAGCF